MVCNKKKKKGKKKSDGVEGQRNYTVVIADRKVSILEPKQQILKFKMHLLVFFMWDSNQPDIQCLFGDLLKTLQLIPLVMAHLQM